jgi:hypothetical protein
MRSLEYLIRLYSDKTAKEILAIQEQDKLADQIEFDLRNEKKLAFIKDINTNGGYYRGKFGLDQHYFYHIYNMKMDEKGNIQMNVDKLVLFCNNDNHKHIVTKAGEIHFERRTKEYEDFDQYDLDDRERVTVKEWEAVNKYVDDMSKLFW